ncbi:MAG: gamma carbonic anhydrase family protein [Clostridia bacterium]|nr:gamma carbonic anhydrase family protein [Clostridia bacterium]
MSSVHKSSFVAEGARIVGDVTVGPDCGVWYNAVLRGDEDTIAVGAGTNLQDCCVVHCDEGFPVTIGDRVTIGHGAVIHGCTIGDGALVGMGATILSGAKIGADAMVAAGALVPGTLEIPGGMLAVGCPAKIKRPLTGEELRMNRENTALYVRLAREAKRKAERNL